MSDFSDEFLRLMVTIGRRRPLSPSETVDAWREFVAQCEAGYEWGVYEYNNELGLRDAIELALRDTTLAGFAELAGFRERVTAIDARFQSLLAEGPEVGGGYQPWWHAHLPALGGEELARDVRNLYGVEIRAV